MALKEQSMRARFKTILLEPPARRRVNMYLFLINLGMVAVSIAIGGDWALFGFIAGLYAIIAIADFMPPEKIILIGWLRFSVLLIGCTGVIVALIRLLSRFV